VAVTRNIQFFLALTELDDKGVRKPYDPSKALAAIDALDWSDRYDVYGERVLRLWPRSGKPSGMLGTVRRTALPPIDRGATIGDLGLGANEGLIEQTFFAVYDKRYVGIVRNQYGPGIGRLADYLDNMTDVHETVDFQSLVRSDTVEQLSHMDQLRVFTFKVRSDAVSELQNDQTIYEFFEGPKKVSDDAALIEVTVSVGRQQNASLGADLKRSIRRLSRRADIGDLATKFEVTYDSDDGERRSVNVLDDRLMSSEEIETTSPRAGRLLEESAYRAIDNAYKKLKDKLETAASIELED
jgi:hypothetical protein